jgi:hypothetical protein
MRGQSALNVRKRNHVPSSCLGAAPCIRTDSVSRYLSGWILKVCLSSLFALCSGTFSHAQGDDFGNTRVPPNAGNEAPDQLVDMVDEEVVGPFLSWANVKRDYRAKGDGTRDDTVAIQNALNDLGQMGKSQVLYLPPGTYKITSTLMLNGSPTSGPSVFGLGGVEIIGADPASTILKWAGPPGKAMLIQNGGVGTRYSRITWDGGGTAAYGVAHWWDALAGRIYDAGTEHQDEIFKDVNIGIMAGRLGARFGQLDSEGQVRRVTFIRNAYAGLDVGSWNALDWWVWDSHFIDCGRGVTNDYSLDDSGPTIGAGGVYVYRSFFERSTVADMKLRNTGWFSLHNNVSVGSRRFFESSPMGDNSAVSIIQGNSVSQAVDQTPISLGNLGPLLLIDNQIQSRGSPYNLTDWVTGRDVLSLGNRLTAPVPIPSINDRLLSVDDINVLESSIPTKPVLLPPTPNWTKHKIFEVPTGATAGRIQSLIDKSALSTDPQPIVHFGHGVWSLDRSLRIPKGRAIELVGDGYGSVLVWADYRIPGPVLTIQAPARVTIRDMQWLGVDSQGDGVITALEIGGANIPGGRIQIVGSTVGEIRAQHLATTQLSLQANVGVSGMFLDDVPNAVSISSGPFGPVILSNNSRLLMADTWYEGSATALFRLNRAIFTYLGGHMAPATHPGATDLSKPCILLDDFDGKASWIGMQFDLSAIPSNVAIEVNGGNVDTRAFFLGLTSNRAGYFLQEGEDSALGTISYSLSRTISGEQDVQARNMGPSSPEDIRMAWQQARSLKWASIPRQVPLDSVDIRIYHMKIDQTGGILISGD